MRPCGTPAARLPAPSSRRPACSATACSIAVIGFGSPTAPSATAPQHTFGALYNPSLNAATAVLLVLGYCLIRQRAINGPRGAAARRIEVLATFDGTNRPLTLSVV